MTAKKLPHEKKVKDPFTQTMTTSVSQTLWKNFELIRARHNKNSYSELSVASLVRKYIIDGVERDAK